MNFAKLETRMDLRKSKEVRLFVRIKGLKQDKEEQQVNSISIEKLKKKSLYA